MSIRKTTYSEGQTVYICGRHVLRGWKGVILSKGNFFGSWYIEIKGKRWLVAGKNLSDKQVKSTKDYPVDEVIDAT